MRKQILILIFLFVGSVGYAQGITFFKGTFAEAKTKAAKENKKIFVDVFTTWCGPCKQMAAKVFTDKAVGDYFNATFVSMQLDAENQANHDFFKQYKATAYPSFFWVDEKGVLLDKQCGSCGADEFIRMAKTAVKAELGKKHEALKKRWESGERGLELLNEYVFEVLSETNPEAVRPAVAEYLKTLSPEELGTLETFDLISGLCGTVKGVFPDDIITSTFFSNAEKYKKASNKYSVKLGSYPNLIYRNFVRMNSAAYLDTKDITKVDQKIDAFINSIRKQNFIYSAYCADCIAVDRAIYTGNTVEGIGLMESAIAKYAEEFPTLRGEFIYTLIISDYFLKQDKPALEKVVKIANDNLLIAPSKKSIAYYAAVCFAAGKLQEAYSAMAWMPFYDGEQLTNAVYQKMNIVNLRKPFPAMTPEMEAENSRVRSVK